MCKLIKHVCCPYCESWSQIIPQRTAQYNTQSLLSNEYITEMQCWSCHKKFKIPIKCSFIPKQIIQKRQEHKPL